MTQRIENDLDGKNLKTTRFHPTITVPVLQLSISTINRAIWEDLPDKSDIWEPWLTDGSWATSNDHHSEWFDGSFIKFNATVFSWRSWKRKLSGSSQLSLYIIPVVTRMPISLDSTYHTLTRPYVSLILSPRSIIALLSSATTNLTQVALDMQWVLTDYV